MSSKYLYARPFTFGFRGQHSPAMSESQLWSMPEDTAVWSSLVFRGTSKGYMIGFGSALMNGALVGSSSTGIGTCGDISDTGRTNELLDMIDVMLGSKINDRIAFIDNSGLTLDIDPFSQSWGQLYARLSKKQNVSYFSTLDINGYGLSNANSSSFFTGFGMLLVVTSAATVVDQIVDAVQAAIEAGVPFLVLATESSSESVNALFSNLGINAYRNGNLKTHTSSGAMLRYKDALGNIAELTDISDLGSYTQLVGTTPMPYKYFDDNLFFNVSAASPQSLNGEEGAWYFCFDAQVADIPVYDPVLDTPEFSRESCCFSPNELYSTTFEVPATVLKPDTWRDGVQEGYIDLRWVGGDLNVEEPSDTKVNIFIEEGPADTVVTVAGIKYVFTRAHPGVVYNGYNGCGHLHYMQFTANCVLKQNQYYGTSDTLAVDIANADEDDIFILLVLINPDAKLLSSIAALGGTPYYVTHRKALPYVLIGSKNCGPDLGYQYTPYMESRTNPSFTVSGSIRGGFFIPSTHPIELRTVKVENNGASIVCQATKKIQRQDNGRSYPLRICARIQDKRFQKLAERATDVDCGNLNIDMPCIGQWDYPDISVADVHVVESDGAPVFHTAQLNKLKRAYLEGSSVDVRIQHINAGVWRSSDAIVGAYGVWIVNNESVNGWVVTKDKYVIIEYEFEVDVAGTYTMLACSDDNQTITIDNDSVYNQAGWKSGNRLNTALYLSRGKHTMKIRALNNGDDWDWGSNPAVVSVVLHLTFTGGLGGYIRYWNKVADSRTLLTANTRIRVEPDYEKTITEIFADPSSEYTLPSVYANLLCFYGVNIKYKYKGGHDSVRFFVEMDIDIQTGGTYALQLATTFAGGMRIDGGAWEDCGANPSLNYLEVVADLTTGIHTVELWVQHFGNPKEEARTIGYAFAVYPYATGSSMYDVYAKFKIHLSSPVLHSDPILVDYKTIDGTASSAYGADFEAKSGILEFKQGDQDKVVVVKITGDNDPEPSETFALALTGATRGTIIKSNGVAVIEDDDDVTQQAVSNLVARLWVTPNTRGLRQINSSLWQPNKTYVMYVMRFKRYTESGGNEWGCVDYYRTVLKRQSSNSLYIDRYSKNSNPDADNPNQSEPNSPPGTGSMLPWLIHRRGMLVLNEGIHFNNLASDVGSASNYDLPDGYADYIYIYETANPPVAQFLFQSPNIQADAQVVGPDLHFEFEQSQLFLNSNGQNWPVGISSGSTHDTQRNTLYKMQGPSYTDYVRFPDLVVPDEDPTVKFQGAGNIASGGAGNSSINYTSIITMYEGRGDSVSTRYYITTKYGYVAPYLNASPQTAPSGGNLNLVACQTMSDLGDSMY